MDTVNLIQQQLATARSFLEGTMADVDDTLAHAAPPGILNPIGATYAHVVVGEDWFVSGLIRGSTPLIGDGWKGRVGLGEQVPGGTDWSSWGRRVQVDMAALRAYASAVAKQTDAWIGSLEPGDLERTIELSAMGFGQQTIAWVLSAGVIGHIQAHWGETCALKGLSGDKVFPV